MVGIGRKVVMARDDFSAGPRRDSASIRGDSSLDPNANVWPIPLDFSKRGVYPSVRAQTGIWPVDDLIKAWWQGRVERVPKPGTSFVAGEPAPVLSYPPGKTGTSTYMLP